MIKAVIIDDENKSIRNLQILIETYCKDISVISTASNALDAVRLILQEKPDLIFLDVQMPGYSGFDVLEQLAGIKAKIIFTTAHKDYAIQALRKGAFDYLLKPIDAEDLVRCVDRMMEHENKKTDSFSGAIELSVKDGIIFIRPRDIIRLEASGSYTTFYLDNNVKHLGSKSMKEYEKFLDPAIFYRCHNSHIVNLKKVAKFISNSGLFAEMNDRSLAEIARKNKEEFLLRLKNILHN
jgi:two-component system LytT family response regulator